MGICNTRKNDHFFKIFGHCLCFGINVKFFVNMPDVRADSADADEIFFS